ncbi:MAG TPA: hypothetical protein G4O11_08770 [Anaerolineae bacterium]|nr:hypothetical protein [Anaerolineae bacterium]
MRRLQKVTRNRVEEIGISIFIAIACPASLFVLLWWSTSALAIYRVKEIPENIIIYVALLGLVLGILLDFLYLKELRARFYNIGVKFLIPLYIFWSAIALAFFMGMPFGNFVLGTLAGLYYGRRLYYQGSDQWFVGESVKKISLFAALVTGIESLFMGLLGLREQIVVELIQSTLGLDPVKIVGPIGIGLVIFVTLFVIWVQYLCTRVAIGIGFKIGNE